MADLQTNTSAPAARGTGTARAGGAAESSAEAPAVLNGPISPEALKKIGAALGGRAHWQAEFGRSVGYSKSNITRYLNGSRVTTSLLSRSARRVLINRIDELVNLLTIEGLPHHADPETLKAQEAMLEVLDRLRKQDHHKT